MHHDPRRDARSAWRERPRPRAAAGHERWCVCLEQDATAPARARAAIEPLRAHLSPGRMDDARLIVSELVTNAVLHAPGEGAAIQLDVAVLPRNVVVSIADQGAGFDPRALRRPAVGAPSGRGLALVRMLADEVGIDRRRPFRVWFRLSTPGDGAAPPR